MIERLLHRAQVNNLFRAMSRKSVFIFIALLSYLYFRGIGDHGLIDPVEGINASVSIHMYASGNYFVPKSGESPVAGSTLGFWWLSALAVSIFGWGEFAVRFWSALSGLVMILASSMSAKTDSPRSSWLAASICASTVLCFAVSQIASSHAIYSCLTGLAMAGVIRSADDKKWLVLSHCAITLAFIAHGFEGMLLPFTAVVVYSFLCDDYDLLKDFFTWPGGIIITIIFCGLYFVSVALINPQIIHFMRCQKHTYSFGGISGAIIFMFASFAPYHGFIVRALYEVFPRKYPSERSPELFMLVWSAVFFLASVLTGDMLSLGACLPGLSGLLGRKLDVWLGRKNLFSVRMSVMLNVIILVPVLYIFLPFMISRFPVMRAALMSLIPWAAFTALFVFASWYYTKTKQIEKWVRNVPVSALLCIMPLAGVFSLTADKYSVRDIGLALRDKIEGRDWVIQYGINYPSVYYYTLRNSIIIDAKPSDGVEERRYEASEAVINILWDRKERVFMIMPEDKHSDKPLPKNIFHIAEAGGMLLLSNQ